MATATRSRPPKSEMKETLPNSVEASTGLIADWKSREKQEETLDQAHGFKRLTELLSRADSPASGDADEIADRRLSLGIDDDRVTRLIRAIKLGRRCQKRQEYSEANNKNYVAAPSATKVLAERHDMEGREQLRAESQASQAMRFSSEAAHELRQIAREGPFLFDLNTTPPRFIAATGDVPTK